MNTSIIFTENGHSMFEISVDYNQKDDAVHEHAAGRTRLLILNPSAAQEVIRRLTDLTNWSNHPVYKWGQQKVGNG